MNDAIIKISGLTKRYGEKTAVNNLYLTVEPGEVFGLLGPNGAGKTTTTLMLLGLTEPGSYTHLDVYKRQVLIRMFHMA